MAKKQKKQQKQPENLNKLCIRKWFLTEYKYIAQAVETEDESAALRGLGLEGALEHCYALFDDRHFLIKAFNENEFFIFVRKGDTENYTLIYDSKNPKIDKIKG